MEEKEAAARFDQASALLPFHLRRRLDALPLNARAKAEELRLRVGRPLFVGYPEGESAVAGTEVAEETIRKVLEIASGSSVHTVLEQMKNGFVTIRGGHRMGLCGTAVMKDGGVASFRDISSLALRVAREVKGIARAVLPKLMGAHGLENTLILSPPGGGKTTLLRDLIRAVSSGEGCNPMRVGVADGRGELAAMADGRPMLDLGPRADVMDGCPKEASLLMLIRGMAPQVIAVDEITSPEDVSAMLHAVGCGVRLLATAHAGSREDLAARPIYRALLEYGVFHRFVVITGKGAGRAYRVYDPEGREC